MAVAPSHAVGMPERGNDGLFAGRGGRFEQGVDAGFMQHGDGRHRLLGQLRDRISGGKCQRDVAAAMAEHRAGARQAGAGA
ncbi:hypothetical protein G6F60_014422 [Rhizopus arrhizus]|nr:hypothetical protein G6F60_014422 [Rhizopus arrhizus]